ncbi:serine hydrolase domain-containing protein [Caulobacter vibrioides]|uniref:serine hydrolase domain-containing protein n=1 Tax=Caulobacter vibrioides TaxID=155892 RepID=UPI000BB4D3DF|nr:serine hydrolase domain-containing protein [Caulobacter vibrioides]ATC25912.1 serine hydrolase [Caulobacter vibrioides]PLR16446.1 serine hydrolase [Caulobacter vibrioides]
MLKKISAAIGLIAIMGGLAHSANAQTTQVADADSKTAAIERLVQSEMASRRIPGLQLAIVKNGKVIFKGAYGQSDLETAKPVTDRTVFGINSISKAFTGVAAMQLVEAGKLDLDASVTQYLQELPPAWKPITVRQILTHTSGLPEIIDDNTRLIDGAEPDAAWARVQELPLRYAPGTQYAYNQTGYALMGKIIEKLSGKRFVDVVGEGQFKAAGMAQARFGNTADTVPELARLYTYLTLQITDMRTVGVERSETPLARQEVWPAYMHPTAGVQATATDLAAWVIALQKRKLVSEKGLQQLWTPQQLPDGSYRGFNKTINGYGLGWPVIRRAEHPAITPTGGNRAAIFIYPKDDLTVIVLTNLLGASPHSFVDKIAAQYIPDLAVEN